jgi:hypothetical protein
MNQPHLDRVREDLQTMRNAAGFDLPFGQFDVLSNVWIGCCGLFITLCAVAAPWEYRGVLALPLGLAVAGAAWAGVRARRERGDRPAGWREHKSGLVAAGIVTPLAVAYMRWERHLGLPRETVGAAALFFIGLALLVIGILDRRRRHYLGGALALMPYGIVLPSLAPPQVVAAGGLCMFAACLSSAAIQRWQLKRAAAS